MNPMDKLNELIEASNRNEAAFEGVGVSNDTFGL